MEWSDSWRSAFHIELRAQAVGLALRGWPVMPGSYPVGPQWLGAQETPSQGLRPAYQDWNKRIDTRADVVANLWDDAPYNLLVATGTVLDAVEVNADLGRRTAAALRSNGIPVPMVATPDNRWLFLTATGQPLNGELAQRSDVTLHSQGSWIPLPPSAYEEGVAHWRVRPDVCGWRLPQLQVVAEAVMSALVGVESELVAVSN